MIPRPGNVSWLIPCRRRRSFVSAPASACFSTPMICSWANWLFLMIPPVV